MKKIITSIVLVLGLTSLYGQEIEKDILGQWYVKEISYVDKDGQQEDDPLYYERGERSYKFKKSKTVTFIWHEKFLGKMHETTPYSIKGDELTIQGGPSMHISLDSSKKTLIIKSIDSETGSASISILER
ncbi:hypothetical protein ORI89_16420 [Sphingobacterium sp. UT-1RO-CII-1]|uniref:hypothetical protein n=1 Tax=Sphingobacterium sp. UT-1RO-CII-1 TaxID=2995225 RepID=UPI00227BFFA5|nr:hypothetical protein [Sphingobacterium sp. UT-1RO-CII-1]MCY4781246.1 hypothetical protein [Sphingobacterium sp. UT-1RO-CII-1]